MHGFVNLFVAAAIARELVLHGYPDPEAQATIAAVIDESDPNAFEWDDDGVTWREHRVDAAELTAMRQLGRAQLRVMFLDEPIEDLRQLDSCECWNVERDAQSRHLELGALRERTRRRLSTAESAVRRVRPA